MSDLIDRDALMKEFQTFVRRSNNHDYAPVPTWNDAVSLVGSMSSAEPERQWIPVTEALPEDMDRILVTIVRSDGEKRVRSGHYYKGYFMMDNGDTWNGTDKEVIAWMPLPEPWRGE